MGESRTRSVAVFAILGAALIAAFILAGCSGESHSLTKDAALVSGWGDTVQYKVDEGWTSDDDANSGTYCSEYWHSKDSQRSSGESVSVTLSNTGSDLYKYADDSTYSGWQEEMEDRYSKSAEDQAKEYNSHSTSTTIDADELLSYSNCDIEDTGSVTVDGQEVRTFSVSYHYKYSDSMYQKAKENQPDFKQEGDKTDYYGLVKDGSHDLEASASDGQLLKDLLSTMEFDW